MNARARLNGALLAAVLLLTALAVIEPGRNLPEVAPLLNLAPASVERLRVERAGQETVLLQREGGGWLLTTPPRGPANQPLIEELLKIPTARCPIRYPAAELDLAKVGLAPPLATLVINDQAVAFGTSETLEQRRYVRVGDTVHLCADRFFHLLSAPAANFAAAPEQP